MKFSASPAGLLLGVMLHDSDALDFHERMRNNLTMTPPFALNQPIKGNSCVYLPQNGSNNVLRAIIAKDPDPTDNAIEVVHTQCF